MIVKSLWRWRSKIYFRFHSLGFQGKSDADSEPVPLAVDDATWDKIRTKLETGLLQRREVESADSNVSDGEFAAKAPVLARQSCVAICVA